jgi:hypothetical protein
MIFIGNARSPCWHRPATAPRQRQTTIEDTAHSLADRSSPWTRETPCCCCRWAHHLLAALPSSASCWPPFDLRRPPPRCDGRSREQRRAEERDGVAGHEASAWWGAGREKRVDGEIIQSVSPSLSTKPFPSFLPSFLPPSLSLDGQRRRRIETYSCGLSLCSSCGEPARERAVRTRGNLSPLI